MLLGQNVNSYGRTDSGEISFSELLESINGIHGLERIRFTTSHPQDLSSELIEAYTKLDKLCEHLHLPVQSGSDSVLQRMRRGYDREKYLDRLGRLRDRCPEVALSTDIIVGFPGETDEEHRATLEILRQIKYDDLFSFMYSPRPQTVAAKVYPDDIPEDVKRARLQTVQMLQGEISLEKNRGLIGTVLPILIEGESKLGKGQVMGRTRTNKIVNLMGLKDLIGKTIPVAITGASANSLMGDTVEARGIA